MPCRMRKNSLFINCAKAGVCLCTVVSLFVALISQSASCSRKQMTLHYVDTLSIPHDIGMYYSFYSPFEGDLINTYYYTTDSGYAVLNYCKGSVFPATQFKHKNYIQNCIIENDSSIIIQFPRDSFLLRIDNQGFVKDTLSSNMRSVKNEKFIMHTFSKHYYLPVKADSGILYCDCFILSELDYVTNYNSRKSMFSRPVFSKCIVGKKQIDQTVSGIGRFPHTHLQKDTSRYFFSVMSTMNKDSDIVAVYAFVDSVFVTHLDGSQESHYFRSKYQKHENEMLTVSVYDYVELEKFSCSQTKYSGILYDPYRNYYYIVVTKPMNPENEDGTKNSSAERPWSLIVLDSAFKQLAEIDMPDSFGAFDCMVTREGLAVMDYSLTERNNNVFVICDIY